MIKSGPLLDEEDKLRMSECPVCQKAMHIRPKEVEGGSFVLFCKSQS